MTLLLVLFVLFAVALPVVLEEQHHPGNNILRRMGAEFRQSAPVRAVSRFSERMLALIAWGVAVIIIVVAMWLLGLVARLIF